MNQSPENISKTSKIVGTIFIIVFVVVGGAIIWQRKHSIQPKQNIQTDSSSQVGKNVVDVNNPENNQKKEKVQLKEIPLSFDSQEKMINTGEKFSLKAVINPSGYKIGGAELYISFDPKTLKLESIIPSEDFSAELTKSKIDNGKGSAACFLGVPLGKESIHETSTIATFNFQPISSSGNSEVNFSDQTMIVLEDGASVPLSKGIASIKLQE